MPRNQSSSCPALVSVMSGWNTCVYSHLSLRRSLVPDLGSRSQKAKHDRDSTAPLNDTTPTELLYNGLLSGDLRLPPRVQEVHYPSPTSKYLTQALTRSLWIQNFHSLHPGCSRSPPRFQPRHNDATLSPLSSLN